MSPFDLPDVVSNAHEPYGTPYGTMCRDQTDIAYVFE